MKLFTSYEITTAATVHPSTIARDGAFKNMALWPPPVLIAQEISNEAEVKPNTDNKKFIFHSLIS